MKKQNKFKYFQFIFRGVLIFHCEILECISDIINVLLIAAPKGIITGHYDRSLSWKLRTNNNCSPKDDEAFGCCCCCCCEV